ncbi:MAG: DUF58 domain-containing protein [Rhodocyclaceae bacterium]|nr:DUF58 domain-containing protein [Rhodocyclaceae bacterium]
MTQLIARLRDRFAQWGVRGPTPEAAPIILTQRRIYVLPTQPGLAFALSIIVMLLGTINYSLSLGYVLVFLLAGLGISAILHAFRNLSRLNISPGRAESVFAGERARFGLHLFNPAAGDKLALRLSLAGESTILVDVPAQGHANIELSLPAPRRGWLALQRITIETTYPLGLVRAWAYAAPDLRCLVYPAPAANAPPLRLGAGDEQGNRAGGSGNDDFAGLRAHQLADSPHHVAWKAVARQADDDLLTKLFSGESSETLWLDWAKLPPGLDTETALAILTRWVLDAHAAGFAWGLCLPTKEFEPATGETHLATCLQTLALWNQEPL